MFTGAEEILSLMQPNRNYNSLAELLYIKAHENIDVYLSSNISFPSVIMIHRCPSSHRPNDDPTAKLATTTSLQCLVFTVSFPLSSAKQSTKVPITFHHQPLLFLRLELNGLGYNL